MSEQIKNVLPTVGCGSEHANSQANNLEPIIHNFFSAELAMQKAFDNDQITKGFIPLQKGGTV